MTVTLDQIEAFFSNFRRAELQLPHLRKAAVLMLFYPRDGELHVVLTKRTEDVEHHKGQISFPGGSQDETDADLIDTALRESEEEIGLPRSAVRILGIYHDYETPTGFSVTPVVGFTDTLPPLIPHVREVAEILEVPLSVFLDKKTERVEKRSPRGIAVDVYFYTFGVHEIWGATAAILRSFLLSLRQSLERDLKR